MLPEQDTQTLAEEIMGIDPEFSLENLQNLYSDTQRLELAIRRILGMDPAEVDQFI